MTILNKVKATDLVDQYWLSTSLRMDRPHISPTFTLVLMQRTEVAIILRRPRQATHDSSYLSFPYALVDATRIKKLFVNRCKGEQRLAPFCQPFPTERPGLQEALDFLQEGDSLVVWRLDRLGRSLRHLIDTVSELEERGIGVRSIQESIDTNTSGGRLILHIFGALAEFERNLIRERTMAGLRAAWARGRVGGRPRKLDAKMTELAYQLYAGKKYAVNEICQILEISKPTLYAYLQRKNENSEKRPQKTFAGD